MPRQEIPQKLQHDIIYWFQLTAIEWQTCVAKNMRFITMHILEPLFEGYRWVQYLSHRACMSMLICMNRSWGSFLTVSNFWKAFIVNTSTQLTQDILKHHWISIDVNNITNSVVENTHLCLHFSTLKQSCWIYSKKSNPRSSEKRQKLYAHNGGD